MLPVVAPTAISAGPTLPDPDDRTTFNTRAYAFTAWERNEAVPKVDLNSQAAYANALASQEAATMAQAAQAVAVAAANFKGAWSGLSGALNVPASVLHNNQYWMLLDNLANVATATPGVSGSWQLLDPVGDVTPINVATNTTMVTGRYYRTTAACDLTLPASPRDGARVWFRRANAGAVNLLRNGNKIEGNSSDYVVDRQGITFCLIYSGATDGWEFL